MFVRRPLGGRGAGPRRPAVWAVALAAIALGVPSGPSGGADSAIQRWQFRANPQVDLWYHGLAVVGFEGFGLLPLYDRDYASSVRARKEARGLYPTPLDAAAADLLRAFDRDSVFELFHFVPLYFDGRDPEAFLASLARVARGSETLDPGGEIVAAVLQSRSRRELLGQFVDLLRSEWDLFFAAEWAEVSQHRVAEVAQAQALWDGRVGPALASFMTRRGLAGGVVFVSPAVGAEGRIFAGVPRDQRDNRAAIWSPGSSETTVFGLVRELCFPLVAEVVARSSSSSWNRVVAERLSSHGAVL